MILTPEMIDTFTKNAKGILRGAACELVAIGPELQVRACCAQRAEEKQNKFGRTGFYMVYVGDMGDPDGNWLGYIHELEPGDWRSRNG